MANEKVQVDLKQLGKLLSMADKNRGRGYTRDFIKEILTDQSNIDMVIDFFIELGQQAELMR